MGLTFVDEPTTQQTQEPLKEPAKAWVNWVLVYKAHFLLCLHCGKTRLVTPGEYIHTHCVTYPSKDVAETVAKVPPRTFIHDGSDFYLGAYPVGEHP